MSNTHSPESINPRDGASWPSTIFFWWMNDLLRLGSNQPLTEGDLFPLLEGYKAEAVIRKAEKCWLDELNRSQAANKKPRLWKAMMRLMPWKSAVIVIVLRTFWALSFAFQPVCLWLVLKTLNDESNMDMKFAIISVALLGTTTLVKVISTHHYDYLTELWALKLKVALIGLVYKKVLSLKRYSLEATLSGNTINLVSNDAQKVERSLNQLGMVLAAPLELTISLVILWYLIGWEALAGAAIFFVLVAFQMLMARKAAKLRDKAATFTDERLAVMNEIISGIRAVKMYAWEWNFRDAVCDIRRKEMAIIRFKGLIFSLLLVLFYTTLPIAVLISVAALALTGTHLSSFTIFTLLLGLDTIKFAFCNSLSISVYTVADAKVALDRIQFFLKDKKTELEKGKQHQTERSFSTEPLNVLQGKGSTEIEMTVLLSDSSDRVDSANLITDTFAYSSSVSTRANNMSSVNVDNIPPVDTSIADVATGLITSHETSIREPFLSISKASCSWNQDSLMDTFTLRDVTLNVCKHEILAITGPVGSGKSSLLTAVLGEIPVCGGTISYYGKVSYVPQIPWIFSGTVRENILFGLPFNEEKFQKIVNVCGLTKDLTAFPNGDLTEIGQRGATLSGGQKARVGLARAVYSDADIYLLDDPLSAVDAKVGRNLFKSCVLKYLSGHIRLFVTHQLQYLKDLDRIAVMKNGAIAHEGGYSELADQGVFSGMLDFSRRLEDDPMRARSVSLYEFNKSVTPVQKPRAATSASLEIRHDIGLHKLLEEDVTSEVNVGFMKGSSGLQSTCSRSRSRSRSRVSECYLPVIDHRPIRDLKEEEEIKTTGTVTWRLYWDYFKAGVPVPLIILLAFVLIVAQVFLVGPNWWLSRMAKMPHKQQKAPVTQGIYTSLVVMSIVVMAASCFFFYYILLKAAENLHNKMTVSAIKAPVLFYDSNPAGRILNRFSKDLGCIDDELPPLFLRALTTCLTSFCAMLVPAATNYWLFLALLPILAIVAFYARYYLKSSRELKRIEAVKCSPVYSHITETVNGLEIVHVSNMSRIFLERLQRYQDENTRAFFMVVSCNRWLAIRIDLLCSVFVITVAVTAIIIGENSVLAGLALTYALQTLDQTQYGMRMATQVENLMTSVERVMAYTKIDSETGYSIPLLPPGSWPSEGHLDIQNLSLVYFHGGPRILKDINVCISSKEKVGVVGRTGAGKSSLVSGLFRMPDPLGKVLIDGVNIGSINLQEARKSMAVITQDTVLFGGTLKRNMDPFSQHTDQELWTALEEVQLKTLVEGLPGQLQFKLREFGTNLSVGERQLVCLARALVQKSKIIIMDEATANVDFKTDRMIQEVIRGKFKNSTVITIAHRLNTILDYDKVLVLDGGQVVEFDKPEVLIRNGGLFSEMVKSQNQSEKC